jgi:hypothetical protein
MIHSRLVEKFGFKDLLLRGILHASAVALREKQVELAEQLSRVIEGQ